jgi:hypothetical protein
MNMKAHATANHVVFLAARLAISTLNQLHMGIEDATGLEVYHVWDVVCAMSRHCLNIELCNGCCDARPMSHTAVPFDKNHKVKTSVNTAVV